MRSFLRGVTLFAGLLSAVSPARGDGVDDYVREMMAREKIPGLSLAIVKEGRVAKSAGYGFANVEHRVEAKPETVYQSGSLGKQFAATAVMMLVEEGKVGLDDPILRFFEGAPASWRDITVRHLLTHTSGLKDYDEKDVNFRRDYTEDELLQIAFGLPIEFPPGSQWSYSNSGYLVLGILVHKVTGKFYGDILRERIFGPLGMDSTRIISEADIVPDRAAGYHLVDSALKNQDWVAPSLNTTADGALYFTALDLAKWDAALYGDRLLKPTSLLEMWTPVPLSDGSTYPYGFGWRVGDQRGHKLISHGGAWQGFRTAISRYVDDRLTVIVLANLAEASVEAIASGVAGIVEPSLRLPSQELPKPDPRPERAAALRKMLADWSGYRRSPQMARGLRDTWTGTAREAGNRKRTGEALEALKSFEFLAEDDLSGRAYDRRGETIRRIVYYKMVTGEETFYYRFYLTEDDSVADFDRDVQ